MGRTRKVTKSAITRTPKTSEKTVMR
jgi:hypothetical protein